MVAVEAGVIRPRDRRDEAGPSEPLWAVDAFPRKGNGDDIRGEVDWVSRRPVAPPHAKRRLRGLGTRAWWSAQGLVVAVGVDVELADEFSGFGVVDADVEVGDQGLGPCADGSIGTVCAVAARLTDRGDFGQGATLAHGKGQTMSDFAAVLPLAFVMIAGPQIISSFFLATSSDPVKNSLSYVAGAALSITTVVTVTYLIAQGATGDSGGSSTGTAHTVIDWIILALVLFLMAYRFLGRKTSRPPSWMVKLQHATPKFAFLLGVALLGVFPTDIASSIVVGLHVGRHGGAWWQCLPFVALTLLMLGLPLLCVLVLGHRANVVLPRIRDWMNNNAWIVSEIVLVLFAALTISSLLSD